jgi:hypothetical protein
MTVLSIADLTSLLDRATPRPWEDDGRTESLVLSSADRALIVVAVNALPWLIEERKRLLSALVGIDSYLLSCRHAGLVDGKCPCCHAMMLARAALESAPVDGKP